MKKPFLIWLTLVFCVFLLFFAGLGLVRCVLRTLEWSSTPRLLALLLLGLGVQLAITAYLALVLHALLRRPRWARGLTTSFVALLLLALAYSAFHPDRHPLIPIRPEEAGGALAGQLLLLVSAVFYLHKMAVGSTPVRHYFSSPGEVRFEVPMPVPPADESAPPVQTGPPDGTTSGPHPRISRARHPGTARPGAE